MSPGPRRTGSEYVLTRESVAVRPAPGIHRDQIVGGDAESGGIASGTPL